MAIRLPQPPEDLERDLAAEFRQRAAIGAFALGRSPALAAAAELWTAAPHPAFTLGRIERLEARRLRDLDRPAIWHLLVQSRAAAEAPVETPAVLLAASPGDGRYAYAGLRLGGLAAEIAAAIAAAEAMAAQGPDYELAYLAAPAAFAQALWLRRRGRGGEDLVFGLPRSNPALGRSQWVDLPDFVDRLRAYRRRVA